ncbi:hypothetical protein TIFTF001_045507 [Ficus carica]|uniref:Uncharacterized protein n=1 Tax=Ficus carica TaxID=3494 RepID=A0AA87YRZ9_FICCA|nr:hypothetical protein TIFTF001_045507 [Ficus carica]
MRLDTWRLLTGHGVSAVHMSAFCWARE